MLQILRPCLAMALIFGFGVTSARADEPRRPSVVFLLADDLGYADLGCFGSKDIPTPNIDSLARGGVRCTSGYVTAGTCSPSRAGLLSGRYQQRFGFEFNCNAATAAKSPKVVGLDPSALTIADILRRAGYATGMVGKWHVGFDDRHHPQARGFEEYFGFLGGAHHYLPANAPGLRAHVTNEKGAAAQILRGKTKVKEERYLTEAFAREACAFIDKHKEKPFFLYVPFNAVHTPFETTDKYAKRFAGVKDEKRRVYYAMVSAMDDAIGAILAALKKNNLEENTLIILLSDNGGPMYTGVQSNGPLRLGKLYLFEGGVRVPFIVRWPANLKGGGEYKLAVSSLDVFPTLAAACQAELPKDLSLDGVNLLPFLKGDKTGPPHETLFWRNGPNSAVRMGDWKMVKAGNYIWLFDLSKDIGETKNLAKEHPEIVTGMRAAFDAWEKQMRPPAWPSRQGKTTEIDGHPYEIHI